MTPAQRPQIFSDPAWTTDGPGDPGIPYLPISPGPQVFAPLPADAGQDASPVASKLRMDSPPPVLTMPDRPDVVQTPSPVQTQIGDTSQRLKALEYKDANPYGSPNNHPGVGGKILHALSVAGNITGDIFAPSTMTMIPGTQLNRQAQEQGLSSRLQSLTTADADDQEKQAQTKSLDLQPLLKQQQLALAQEKQNEVEGHHRATEDQALAQHGFAHDENNPGQLRPLRYEEMSPTQQAVTDLKGAQQEQAEATAALRLAQNDPSSPGFKLAQGRLAVAQKNAQIALGRLGIAGANLQLRTLNTNASIFGKDADGNVLPGAALITGDDGTDTAVGSKFAPAAIKQQKAVGSFNDLSGSVAHARESLSKFFSEGGSLSDPMVVAAMSDPTSTIGKVINGKLVQGGLSTSAITAINAVRQLHEQAGILRSTTGGTASEAGAQRILDVVPSAGDSNDVAINKLLEQDKVLQRLAPGQTRVSGGLSVKKPAHEGHAAPSGFQAFTDGGVTYHIPSSQVAEFKKDHPNAR